MTPSATSEPVVVPIIDDRKLESKHLPFEAESVKEPENYSGVRIGSAQPLKLKGVLDQYKSFDITPIIGKEFPEVQLVDLINAENSDELLRDLAITISQRNVVVFRQQAITNDEQKKLIQRLGLLAGKPATSGLHIHPILNSSREGGGSDPEISTISSVQRKKLYEFHITKTQSEKRQSYTREWHADISFEPAPADYSSLRLVQLPATGGDTLFASGYELFDRLSPPYQQFLSTLSATFDQEFFKKAAEHGGYELYAEPRGSPYNIGIELRAVHPVIRTNPVTGWKSIFPVGGHVKYIKDLTEPESTYLLQWFVRLVADNHDIQMRLKWQNEGDIAIYIQNRQAISHDPAGDNRSTFHAATFDYDGLGDRSGNRAVGVGERPFFDPKSTSRREALFPDED